jgi:ABC-type multidrug transport system ATPase subunit
VVKVNSISVGEGSSATPAIEVEDLTKVYPGGTVALEKLSFIVRPGEIFGLLGPNGAGKSTAVRILVTLLRKTSGRAAVNGFDTETQPDKVRELIGYAGQATGVDDDLTGHENLFLQGFLHGFSPGKKSLKRVDEMLELFSLTDVQHQRAGRLSGGLRRRLDLAQALLHKPSVLFLDEPTTGVDPQSRNALWGQLRKISREEGTTVLLTTQYLEEADRVCDRVAIIDRGRLVKLGTPGALKEEVGEGRLILTLADDTLAVRAAELLANNPEVTRVQAANPLQVYVRDVNASVIPVIDAFKVANIQIISVEQTKATLDDVFLRYTGDRPHSEPIVVGAVSSIFGTAHGRKRRGGS